MPSTPSTSARPDPVAALPVRPPAAPMTTAADVLDDDTLRAHLVATRLAGEVATTPRNTIENCGKLARGHPDYHFGLPDWRSATVLDALAAIRDVCGGDPGGVEDLDGPGWIDPDATLHAIRVHAAGIEDVVAGGGAKVLLATGHPPGLLSHYSALGRHLAHAGSQLLTPLDDEWIATAESGGRMGVRFVEGVACAYDGGSLRHTHRPSLMEAMLDAVEEVELVIGDHGMAGAAIAAGIRTLSIADVNDPGLPLAQVRGRTDAVLPIDDNLAPRVFAPVTARMLAGGDGRRR